MIPDTSDNSNALTLHTTATDGSEQTQTSTRKRGAPFGNHNARRHGLTAGTLPRGHGYVERSAKQFRRDLETILLEQKGEITLMDAATINTAVRWERHAMLAQKWLRDAFDDMDHDQRLAFSRDVAKASESRDRSLRALGIAPRDYRGLEIPTFSSPPQENSDEHATENTEPHKGDDQQEASDAEV